MESIAVRSAKYKGEFPAKIGLRGSWNLWLLRRYPSVMCLAQAGKVKAPALAQERLWLPPWKGRAFPHQYGCKPYSFSWQPYLSSMRVSSGDGYQIASPGNTTCGTMDGLQKDSGGTTCKVKWRSAASIPPS